MTQNTFSNNPPDTNIIDADLVNENFDDLYDFMDGTGYARSLSGVVASRPAASAVLDGTHYFSTDTGDVSRSDGTTWFTLTPAATSAFIATDATGTWAAPSSGTPLDVTTYDTETMDIGSNFNPTTGVFTAPVKGLYHFEGQFEISSYNTNDTVGLRLITTGTLDSGTFPMAFAGGDGNEYSDSDLAEALYGQRFIRLSASGTCKLSVVHVGGAVGFANARFAGHLVQQLV